MKYKAIHSGKIAILAIAAAIAISTLGCGANQQNAKPASGTEQTTSSEETASDKNASDHTSSEDAASEEQARVNEQSWTMTPKGGNGQAVSGSRVYIYDDAGVLLEMKSSSNGKSVVYHYEYDAAGNMIHEYTGTFEHVLTYDADNHLLTDNQTNTLEDGSKSELHRSYTYYENGKVETYATDESGKEEIWRYGYNDEYYAIQKPETIEYYDYEDRLIADSALGQNKEEIPKGLYAYDEHGNLSGYENAGGTHMECENTYNEAGLISSSLRTVSFSDGSEGTYQELYEYSYDSQGQMISKTYYKLPQNGEKTMVESYIWEYNTQGNLLREVFENEKYTMENLYTYEE